MPAQLRREIKAASQGVSLAREAARRCGNQSRQYLPCSPHHPLRPLPRIILPLSSRHFCPAKSRRARPSDFRLVISSRPGYMPMFHLHRTVDL